MFLISRPVSWIIFPLGYGIGLVLGGIQVNLFHLIQMFTLTLPASFVMFGINDVYDIDSDKLNPRKKDKFFGIVIDEIDVPEIKKISLFFSILIIVVSLFSFNLVHIFLTFLAVISVYVYSVPPIRIKSRPIIDSIFNMLFIYLPFAMGYSLMGTLDFLNIHFIIFGLLGSAAHAIGTVSDLNSDKKTGIKTFATQYGHVLPLIFALFLFLINIPFALNIELGAGILLIFLSLATILLMIYPTAPIFNWMILSIVLWMFYAIILYSFSPGSFNLSGF